MTVNLSADVLVQYDALVHGAGVADLGCPTQLEVTGRDRATLLHNLCTNDIQRLQPGEGCEAFITNVQGRTIGYVLVFCGPDSLWLATSSGQAEALRKHFEHYTIREDAVIHDRSQSWEQLLLAGDQASDLLSDQASTPIPGGNMQCRTVELAGEQVEVRRTRWAGPASFFIAAPAPAAAAVRAALEQAGAVPCGAQAVEMARIEAGTPVFGRDISDANLPQELARNPLAISFTKGCYLGQETVARLDALGHVNRTLCGIRFSGSEIPHPGLELIARGKRAAQVTSAAYAPRLAAPLALGYVRRGDNEPGCLLDCSLGRAAVVRLPLFD